MKGTIKIDIAQKTKGNPSMTDMMADLAPGLFLTSQFYPSMSGIEVPNIL